MTLSTDELDWLIRRLCPEADAAALGRIESRLLALTGTVGRLDLGMNILAETIGALQAQENTEMSQLDDLRVALDATKQAITDAAARVTAKLDALAAANTQPDLAPLIAEAQDEAASLGQIVPADVPPAPAPDPTQTAPDGGAASPAPSDGSSAGGDGTTPAPATGTGTDASATGPAA